MLLRDIVYVVLMCTVASAQRYFGGRHPNFPRNNRRYSYRPGYSAAGPPPIRGGYGGYPPSQGYLQRPAYRPGGYPDAPFNPIGGQSPIYARQGGFPLRRPSRQPRRRVSPPARRGPPPQFRLKEQELAIEEPQRPQVQYEREPARVQYQREPARYREPQPAVVSNARPLEAKPVRPNVTPVDVSNTLQNGYQKIANLQNSLSNTLGDLKLGSKEVKVNIDDVPVPNVQVGIHGDEIQDADYVRSYGYSSDGYGYQRRNDKKELASKTYGYHNDAFGYRNDPASPEDFGAEKHYGFKNTGSGVAKQNKGTSERTYSYQSQGVGAAKRTVFVDEDDNSVQVELQAQSKYGFQNKGVGTHENDGKKEKKSYGFSNTGYGSDVRQSDGAAYTPDEDISSYSRPAQQFARPPQSYVPSGYQGSAVPGYAQPSQ